MQQNYYLSEEEIARRRRIRRKRKKLKAKRRRLRKIRGIILLTLTLIIFITLIIGIFRGVYGIIRHFTGKQTESIEAVNSDMPENVPDKDLSDNTQDSGSPSNILIPYASLSDQYMAITSDTVHAPYAILMNADNSYILAGRDYDTRIYPASLTKVMTLIIAVENMDKIPSTYTFTTEDIAPLIRKEASRAGFVEDDPVSVEDLLYGLILPSGADAAVGIANLVAGSEASFADLMNEKCREIGLTQTHFTNPSGLYDENQYSTCAEIAMIMSYAMKNELCAKVLSTYQYTTTPSAKLPEGLLLTSTMFSRMYGNEVEGVSIIAGKTGYTVEAGNCMVSYAIKDGTPYVCVTAASSNKWHCIYDAFEIYGNYLP